ELAGVAKGIDEYDVDVSGHANPEVLPLPIDCVDACYLAVGCRIRAQTVSMSDLHSESASGRSAAPFGQDCDESNSLAVFTHPETLDVIEVPDAGCARFWIEFNLGKFIFPTIRNGDLRILNARL